MKFFALFLMLFCFATGAFAQQVLVDDIPMCGHHDRSTYQALWDTLTTAGASMSFTSDAGRFPDLSSYDLVILMHYGGCVGITEAQRFALIEFVCHGGNIIVMPIGWDDVAPLNALLNDSRWRTGLYFSGEGGSVRSSRIAALPPITDGIDYLWFEATANIIASTPAMPFAFNTEGTQVIAALSYPIRLDGDTTCNCENGGRILAIADNHTFEAPVVGYIEPMDHRFMAQAMLALARVSGHGMEDCLHPAGIPTGTIDTCADPGATVTIRGECLRMTMTVQIGGRTISPSGWTPDSTSLSFVVPDLPQGIYPVSVADSSRTYGVGTLRVFCTWRRINGWARGCFMPGDTVRFTGENFIVGSTRVALRDRDGGTYPVTYTVESETSGTFIVPELIDTATYHSFIVRVTVTPPGNYAERYIRIPCPCPGQADRYAEDEITIRGVRTLCIPPVLTPFDSCLITGRRGAGLRWTGADSAVSVTALISPDNGTTWNPLVNSYPNNGFLPWTPNDTSHTIAFLLESVDGFGNRCSDTLRDVCVRSVVSPLTGHIRPWTGCQPETLVMTIRDRSILDSTSLFITQDDERFAYPERMAWLDDTTLIFVLTTGAAGEIVHWVQVSELAHSLAGEQIRPDFDEAFETEWVNDTLGPVITPLSPTPDAILTASPSEVTVGLRDLVRLRGSSLLFIVNGDTMRLDHTGLSLEGDTLLRLDPVAAGVAFRDDNQLCLTLTDSLNDPICNNLSQRCWNFTIGSLTPVEWSVDLTFTPKDDFIDPQTLTLGVSPDGTEAFDTGLDRVALPPPDDQQEAWFPITDPAYPAIIHLQRDIRSNRARYLAWLAISVAREGELTWQTEVLPRGVFLLDSTLDMRTTSHYSYSANETVLVEYYFPDFVTTSRELHLGWNLIGIGGYLDDPQPQAVFGPGALIYGWTGTGYYNPSILTLGEGYWLFSDTVRTVNIPLSVPASMSWTIRRGWNLIGGPAIEPGPAISTLPWDPVGPIQSWEWRLRPAYDATDTLHAGYGVWLLFGRDANGSWRRP